MNCGLMIFGGTSEGRELAERLNACGKKAHIFTATDYGARLLQGLAHMTVHCGRLNAQAMYDFMVAKSVKMVVDATHPYAAEVTENIVKAARKAGAEYVRVIRRTQEFSGLVSVASVEEAVLFLGTTQGAVLLTTGSKTLAEFCVLPNYQERLFVRVLPMPDVLAHCQYLGLLGKNIVAMQGPFSYELNMALMVHCQCKYVVTKNTGKTGGMDAKVQAAMDFGAQVVVIEPPTKETGFTVEETLSFLGVQALAKEQL